ncbi:hypothetical protein J5N97_006122 [Dioscorea zingiberensis]|uniref:Selenoprotein H n=1 Tax=Dioscorea zingiberensis TaxID=325984 RepID=A0A9D5HTE5_9LILI|nr:hypothetical protein J5N97_006122 [Dioscorea zingiberensis]
MAPKRKEKNPSSSPPPVISQRVTRSSTAAKREAQSESPAAQPAKKSKTTVGKGRAKVTGGGKGKSEASKVGAKEEVKPSGDAAEQAHGSYRTILIEACKQCTSFKKRALIVKEGLENGIPDITVEINPEKPRRGCFEIRDSGGEIFLSLQNMARPFTPMKNLEMDEVVKDIVQKIQALP